MSNKAAITPKVLKWSRETAKFSEADAASKLSISLEKLLDWEEGRDLPTIRQAQILAKAYKRPFALLFLPEIPKDFHPLQDFRKKGSINLGTASTFLIREIQQKQAWMSEENQEAGESKIPFVGRFSEKDDPKLVSRDILDTLDINPMKYEFDNPMKEWLNKAESKGIFISRTSFIHSRLKLDSEELQGFAIADPFAPFVFINSHDWNAPQLFTLVHELAHIWISESGLSNKIESGFIRRDKYHSVELFCNQVAANSLMPEEFITNIPRGVFESSNDVFNYAKSMGVSTYAFLVRAKKLDVIKQNQYLALKNEADEKFAEFLLKEKQKKEKQKKGEKGGPNYYLLQLNRNSRLFTQTVLDAFKGGRIEPTKASQLLNIQTNKFPELEAQLYR